MKRISTIILLVSFSFLLRAQISESFPAFFPKMKSADKVMYIPITNDSEIAKHIDRVFQGIINRDSAELILSADVKDSFWLKYSGKKYKRPPFNPLTGDNAGLRTLVKLYKDRINKLVVCNFEDNDFTWNMAVNIASVENALPVNEALKDLLIKEFNWNIEVVDIRLKWKNVEEAYDWALTELMPKMNKKIIFSLGLRDDWRGFSWRLYDYAVATRSFTFWLNNHQPTELNLIKKILNTPGYPKNSCVMGYGMFGDDLNDAINPEGFGFLVGDIFPNASFYSSFPTKQFKQMGANVVNVKKNKIYVALHWSDGDNIQFNHNASLDIFQQPARGKVPVSMTLSPSLMEIAPFILDFYYKNATLNDEFIGGPSGLQYIQEKNYKPTDYQQWCIQDGKWLDAAGMYVTASSFEWPAKPFLLNNFLKTNVIGTIAWSNSSYKDAYGWLGLPVICTGGNISDEEALFKYLSSLSPSDHMPIFSSAYLIQGLFGRYGYAAINRVVARLEAKYPNRFVFLKASDLLASAKNYFVNAQKPFKQIQVPGKVEAEDFDLGGQGAAYYVLGKEIYSSEYRKEAGNRALIKKGGSGYLISGMQSGEWYNYTVDIKESGNYSVAMRYISRVNMGGLTLMLDDKILSTVSFDKTTDINVGQDYTEILNLPKGIHNLKIQYQNNGVELDYLNFEKTDQPLTILSSEKKYRIISKLTNKVLALKNRDLFDGTDVVAKESIDGEDELWKFDLVGDGYYKLTSIASGTCLTVKNESNIKIYPFNYAVDNMKWHFHCLGNNEFRFMLKGKNSGLAVNLLQLEEVLPLILTSEGVDENQLFLIQEYQGETAINQLSEESILGPFPMPFKDEISFLSKAEGEFSLNIYDNLGKLIFCDYCHDRSTDMIKFDIGKVIQQKGFYIYCLKNTQALYSKKGIIFK